MSTSVVNTRLVYVFRVLILAGLNFAFGKMGLLVSAPPGYATLIWPPSGIAVGMMFVFGGGIWPGVFIASLLLNSNLSETFNLADPAFAFKKLYIAGCIAIGSSLQAWAAYRMVHAFYKRHMSVVSLRNILIMAVLAGPLGCLIAPTAGVGTLLLFGEIGADKFLSNFLTWWSGDTLGVLVFAPLVIFCFTSFGTSALWGTRVRLIPSLAVLALLVTLGITLMTWKVVSQYVYEKAQEQFKNTALENEKALLYRLDSYEQGLQGALGFMSGSEFVSREEWGTYVEVMDVRRKLPGILGIGYISYVRADGLEAFINRVREDNKPDFNFYPADYKDSYFIITYIEPVQENSRALGLNIAFEENRRNAALMAMDTGNATVTNIVRLVQAENEKGGFLLLLPLYKKGMPVETVEQRRLAIEGWIYAPFVAQDFMKDLTGGQTRDFALSVYAGAVEDEKHLIYSDEKNGADKSLFSVRKTIKVKQQEWTMVWNSTAFFQEQSAGHEPMVILVGGGLFMFLLGVFLITLMRRTELVQKQVDARTTELKEREAVLEKTVEKLTMTNAELERFAYVASHDMQEPLRMVTNFSTALLHQYGSGLDMGAKRYIGFIISGAERIQSLVTDLLEFARVGHEGRQMELVDGHALFMHVLENLGPRIAEAQATVTYDTLPSFRGYPVQFICLLQNLIGNALKYRLKDVKPVVHVGVVDDGPHWRFSIRDNGIGIEEKYQAQIFEPFKRLHSFSEYEGTGLGLSVCKKIAANHGGDLWVESRHGEGSTFYFTIAKR